MKRILGLLSALILLTGCSNGVADNNEATPGETTAKVPANCELTAVNAAFAKIIPPSKYIPTKWQPAAGTDLAASLDAGGIACTYGDQDAEVGGTILWASDQNKLWDSRLAQWKQDGLIKVDIPGINETAAYKTPDGATSADGMPAWRVNLLIDGIWIQLGAAFIQSWDEATPIIEAAINATKAA